MGGVDIFDQKTAAYKLDCKSSGGCYYLRSVFNLMDISVVNLHAICIVLYPNGIELLHLKIYLAKLLICTCNGRSQNTSVSHMSRREVLPASVPIRLPVLQKVRETCRHCYTDRIETKTCIPCNTCGLDFETAFAKVHTEFK